MLYIYVNQHILSCLVKFESIFLSYSEFHKQNWKLRHQPTSNQVEMMRQHGINGEPNFLSWFQDYVKTFYHITLLS
jgi:hypothetical protein